MSSVLEAEASSASSDSSPVLVVPPPERSRRRAVALQEEEESDAETDELEQPKSEDEPRGRPKSRRSSRRLMDELSPPPSTNNEDASSASPSSRYSLRTRRSKPKRFDESMYNDVFTSSHYAESTPESVVNSRKRRRREKRKEKRKRSRRLRTHAGEDDSDDEMASASYDGELSIKEINRRIKAQEQAEKEARSRETQRRSTRYSLRSRESLGSMSVMDSVSPPPQENSGRGSKRAPLDVSTDADGVEAAHEQDEDGDNDSQSENEEANSEDDNEDDDEEGEGAPASSTRYHLRRRSQTQNGYRMDDHRNENSQAASSSAVSTRSRARNSSGTAFEADEGTAKRYSLRDRSKIHRADGDDDAHASPEAAAYAEYRKRQTNGRAGGSRRRGASGANRRLYLSDMADSSPRRRGRGKYIRGRRNRRRRSLSSSSSGSSSSSDAFMDDDDSDGGMRTSSPWRSKGSRKSGSSRADITPVEVDRSITWDSVGGLKSHIEALKEMVMLPLLYPEFYDKYNVAPPSGVLFYGPPGTGKTLLARALANSCSIYGDEKQGAVGSNATTDGEHKKKEGKPRRHVTFYMRKGADCLSKWVGEAERQLRLLFEEAKRNQPSIIFFDEIDGLAPVRSAKQDQIHASIVSTLLALMDGMDSRGRVVVIGATNRLDAIDPALRRPGRFDRELGFKLPSVNERKSMLAIHSKHWNPPLSDRFLSELAEQTVGYCGADIKALCAEAALCSLRRVYPQVYASENKLLINLDKVVVARGDFVKASKKITPASHRAVSSFASPLPRAVKRLLEGSLKSVLRDVARHFPLFPLDRASIDDATTAGNETEDSAGSIDEDEDEDDMDIYAIANHADCDVCHGDEGELLCCDACPGAFHRSCLATDQPENALTEMQGKKSGNSLWFCPECLESNIEGVEKAVQRTQKKRIHSIASLHLPRHSGFPRVLVSGQPGMGQQYIGPALLHSLEGLTHFSLDYPSLVADSNSHFPEEALIQRLTEAQKCLPCVLYLPQAELWWRNTSESMHLTLKMMLMNLQVRANLPILFLACTASSSRDDQSLPEDLLALFKEDPSVSLTSIVMELDEPAQAARRAHFEQVFDSLATPPTVPSKRRTKDEKLEVLPLAPLPPVQSELSPEEQHKRKERDLHFLRELRIFLSQVLDYCYSQKLYTPFYVPVDPEAVPNYYLIVKNPMDLSTMRDKLNDEDYTCFEQFMDDIQLIVRNANVFNPKRSRTRHIAHAAGTMKDNILSYAHRFRIRQGYDLFAKCRDVTKRLRANPAMYGDYGQRYLKSKSKGADKSRFNAPEKPGVRTSARLRGVKAPEISLDDAIHHSTSKTDASTSASEEVAAKKETVKESQQTDSSEGALGDGKHLPVAQWFGDEEDDEEKKSSSSEGEKDNDEDDSKQDNEKGEQSSEDDKESEEGKESDEEEEAFDEGDRVFVSRRSHPGVNREGGAGVVQGRNKDGTYNVKYILGGSEKGVSVKYIKRLTDDAVMESVKVQRSAATHASAAEGAAASVRLIQDEEKMDETDYFDELLWPILKEEGWSRDDNFDIIEASGKEAGLAVQRVVFVPGKQRDGASVTLNGVMEAMAYITADPELSQQCFGTRYAEAMLTEKALGGHSSDEETIEVDAEGAPGADSEKAAEKVDEEEEKADEPMPQAEEDEEDVQETPDFIYDEARMEAVLQKLVANTAHWTVDKLRDELLLLNKLAYPFRNRFDREELMKLLESHVSALP